MQRIKVKDEVIVTAGKDRGRTGKVIAVYKAENKLKVEGVNVVKKHIKPNPHRNIPGGINQIESKIDASNISIYNPQTKKADKVGFKVDENGDKRRIFRKTGQFIDV